MIVCSCNHISDAQIVAARDSASPTCPFSPGKAYKSLGCKVKCGRCLDTVRSLLSHPQDGGCVLTGEPCKAADDARQRTQSPPETAFAIAAE